MTDRPSARGSSVALEATRTRAQYLDAIEDIACAYIATDRRGIVVDANRVASVMLGCPVLEKALIGFVARGDTHVFRVLLHDLAAQRSDHASAELRLRKRGGPVFAARIAARTVYGPGRDPVALRWLVRPVASHPLGFGGGAPEQP